MKKFILFLCLFSCSQSGSGETLDFDQIDSMSPIETIVEKSDEIYIAEKNSSVKDLVTTSTVPAESVTTTSTTVNSEELAVRFQEIIEPYLATNITEITNEDYYVNKYSFKFEEKIYTISYNFETDTSYCNYLDYQYNDPLLNSYNLYIFDLEHSMLNKESIAVTYVCKKDTEHGQDLFYDYIFKVDNQCYIYKNLDLIEYLEKKISEENLHIVTSFLDFQPNSIFLKPSKIYYSGYLNKDCEKSAEIVNIHNQTNELGFEVNSIDLCCENIINPDTGHPFGGHYHVRYRTLTEFEYCRDQINNLVHNFAKEFEFWEYFPGEYLDQTIALEISVFSNLNNFLIKLDINSNIAHLPGGVMWYYDDIFTYILDGSCSVISSPGNTVNLFDPSNKLNLTAIASHVVQQYETWVEEFEWFLETIPENIYIDYKYDNERVVFDLTNMLFWKNFSTNSFNCDTVYKIYNYDNFFSMPTWNYYRPVVLHAKIYELSKVSKINLPLDKFSKCENFQT